MICCEFSPKSLSDGRDLRQQEMGAEYENRDNRIILSYRPHDYRLYSCPKLIAKYLLSRQMGKDALEV